ncbi:MAG TPA: hypothetical protein VFV67_07785 [Actinophytocola sp.]|uniref:hypothetical protein n=1 Tax=Actinophytocola sp. TaxID=1872138 RepID=UPI002DB973B6|nr:hypothetical protein [Actinophytocola sp.]HEU5470539.1 hypothetical protein [Actinophytocola sp.]
MLADLAISLGICQRLYDLIRAAPPLPPTAQLDIRVYDEVPHFAYHREDDDVIVGFYFLSALGSASAAFEVLDPQTKAFFEGHFATIFDRAASDGRIIEVSSHRTVPDFNATLYRNLCDVLTADLGGDRCEALMSGNR